MNKYEILYILRADIDDAAKESLVEKYSAVVTNMGGTVDNVNKWGARKLAYPIDYKKEGYYVLVDFTAGNTVPAELERLMRNDENVMRFMVLRKD